MNISLLFSKSFRAVLTITAGSLLLSEVAFALPATTAAENKFVSANLQGFVIQDGHDFSITSAPQRIGPSTHYRFNTSGTVHGTNQLGSYIPAGSDVVTSLNKIQSGLGTSLRGAVFESVFGDNYPILNRTVSGSIAGIISVSGQLDIGVSNGVATFSLTNFSFTVFGSHDSFDTIVFDNVLLVGESADIIKSDFNFDANADLPLLNTKSRQVELAYLNSSTFLGGTLKKSLVTALNGAKIPSGFLVVGVADFDLDGNIDLLLFNSKTRQTEAVTMNLEKLKGTTLANSIIFGPVLPAGYVVGGIGDFNLDGNWDILAYNPKTLATLEIFLKKGMGLLGADLAGSSIAGPKIPKGYDVVSVSDFNDDSTSDLLLYNAKTRASAAMLLSGIGTLNTLKGPTLAKDWTLIGSSGFDNNRSIDLLIYNAKTNQAEFYLNKGTTFSSLSSKPSKALTLPAGTQAIGLR